MNKQGVDDYASKCGNRSICENSHQKIQGHYEHQSGKYSRWLRNNVWSTSQMNPWPGSLKRVSEKITRIPKAALIERVTRISGGYN